MSGMGANPVAWLEGMFLRPQHMQQQDQYWEGRLRDQLRSLDPFHWGVRSLEINEGALSDHRVEVLSLECVLPNGVELRTSENCAIAVRELPKDRAPLDIWVGVRRPRGSEPHSLAHEIPGVAARYRVRSDERVPDLHGGVGEAAAVDFLVPNPRLYFSGEEIELEQTDAIRIARVVSTGKSTRPFAIADDYAPPLLYVQAFRPLDQALDKLLAQMAAKCRVVAARTATLAMTDLPRVFLRFALARMTPLLRQLKATGTTRPFDLYCALVETAGALGTFRHAECLELPPYEHANPYPNFERLVRLIEDLLEDVVPQRFHEIEMPFERTPMAYTTAKPLSGEWTSPENYFFLGIRSKTTDTQDLLRIVGDAKCSAVDGLDYLRNFNLSGLRLDPLPAAPSEIVSTLGFQYWRVEANDPLWAKVRASGNLALFLGRLEAADVRLYVVESK